MLPVPGTDFFPCGTRVQMPTLHAAASVAPKESPDTPGKDTPSESRRGGLDRPTLKRHVTEELGRTLQFSHDVVSSRSPQAVSYAKAKGEMREMYRPSSLGVILAVPNTVSEPIGRHDCRGDAKKHSLCHLRAPPRKSREMPALPAPRRRSRSLPSKTADDADWTPQAHQLNLLSPCPSQHEAASSPRHSKMVPASASVLWEEQTLQRLSSATARRLVEECPRARERARLEELLRRRWRTKGVEEDVHSPSSSHADTALQASRTHSPISPLSRSNRPSSPSPLKFTNELSSGARPVCQQRCSGRMIILDNDTTFHKVLQRCYPQQPEEWCGVKGERDRATYGGKGCVRGQLRWTDFPQPVRTPEDLQWVYREVDSPVSEELLSSLPTEVDTEVETERSASWKQKLEYFEIFIEWMDKWQIHIKLGDITASRLADDLHSLCDNSRMAAIATIVLQVRRQQDAEPRRLQPTSSEVAGKSLEEGELSRLLADPVLHVRVPAAIALLFAGERSERACEVLQACLEDSGAAAVEVWASASCLAVSAAYSPEVVSALLRQLLEEGGGAGHERRAAKLLARLSYKTPLVSALLVEKLNSSSSKDRLLACQLLPRLHKSINKDVGSKLVELAWEDWRSEVRDAAAQALGVSGHGKLIHDEIQRRLSAGNEMERLDALKKLRSLGLVSPHLLPAFLACFSDDHVSIRIEAITLAGSLQLKEPQVLLALQQLLQDHCWKVKAHTLRALSEIGVVEKAVVDKLLWAVRFEKLPAVRAEACRAIAQLRLREDAVVSTLKDLLTVEDNPLVLREVSLALQGLAVPVRREDHMLDSIRDQVQRLGTMATITRDVLQLEQRATTDYVIERPRPLLTTRDYLTDRTRHKQYSKTSSIQTPMKSATPPSPVLPRQPPTAELVRKHSSSWAPDKAAIDRQLSSIRKQCTTNIAVENTM